MKITKSEDIQKRKESLATFLNANIENINCTDEKEKIFSIDDGEYLVLTFDEAFEKTEEAIKEALCYSNPEFIYLHSTLYGTDTTENCLDTIRAIQDKKDPSLVENIIKGMSSFIEDAIEIDGMGLYLAYYDCKENEQGKYLIYRVC